MQPRHLTVSRHYPESRTASSLSAGPMPFLRLQGRWLDKAGFGIGANVRVEVAPGRLVMEVIEFASQREQER